MTTDGTTPTPNLSLLIVRRDGAAIEIITERVDHGDAHAEAEAIAKSYVDTDATIAVYRRIATYDAKVTVTMRRDGE